MNLINKVLILIIIIIMINYLTNGKIIDTLKRYMNVCVEKMTDIVRDRPDVKHQPYTSQLDFPYLNQNDPDTLDIETYNLYRFLDKRVRRQISNYELTSDMGKPIEASEDVVAYILKALNDTFNHSGYEFKNIKILEKIHYMKHHRGKNIIPFKMSADVIYNKEPLGSIILYIESFVHEHLKGHLYSIINIRLIERKHPSKNKEKEIKKTLYHVNLNKDEEVQAQMMNNAIKDNKKLNDKMTESFNEHFMTLSNNTNDDFEIPTICMSDIENYELDSPNITSNN